MKPLETETNDMLNLPTINSPKSRSNFTYYQKSDKTLKSSIKDDLKVNFLTRYNKKFWESKNKENNVFSRNYMSKPEIKVHKRYKSKKKIKPLDLIEVNDFDDRMKNELENIDRWIFNNLKKMSLPVQVDKKKKESEKNINLDMQMLDFIVQNSHKALESPGNQTYKKNIRGLSMSKDLHKKIAITSETLNNEHNKAILIDMICKKILRHKEYQRKDSNHNLLLAKMIATDLIASFKVLNVFKHQNILRLKEILESISGSMESVRTSFDNYEHISSAEDYIFYEKTLKKNLKECEDNIKSRKEASKKLLDAIRVKKTNINAEKQRLFNFVKMLEEKENETNKNRKIGEKMKLREFMEINEYKSKKIKLEATIEQYIMNTTKEITDMDLRIENIEKEVDELKFKKTWFIFKLKEFYIDFLYNEDELIKINKNIIYIIKSIWSLNEEVYVSSFSKFYEKEDVKFMFKYAKVHNEFLSARADNNSIKKEIKDSLRRNFDDILNEDEYEIISNYKESIQKFKEEGLKFFVRKRMKTSKRTSVYKYNELDAEPSKASKNNLMTAKFQNKLETNNMALPLSLLSEKLSHLKEEHIQIIVRRTIEKNNRSKLLNKDNSDYLKKMLRLLFGHQEMQITLKRLLKDNHIQIIPI